VRTKWLDPILVMRFVLSAAAKEDHALTLRETILRVSRLSEPEKLVVPIPAGAVKKGEMGSGHWTLLSMDFSEGKLTEVRYRDSLTGASAPNRVNAQAVLSLFDAQRQLPERCNLSMQPMGSAACGWWVLAWAEEEYAERYGAGFASLGWPQAIAQRWKTRLGTFHATLRVELQKQKEDATKAEEKAKKELQLLLAKAKIAGLKTAAKQELLETALKAKKNLESAEWIEHISVADLPEDMKALIAKVAETNYGVCSKCRWTSGCKDSPNNKKHIFIRVSELGFRVRFWVSGFGV